MCLNFEKALISICTSLQALSLQGANQPHPDLKILEASKSLDLGMELGMNVALLALLLFEAFTNP